MLKIVAAASASIVILFGLGLIAYLVIWKGEEVKQVKIYGGPKGGSIEIEIREKIDATGKKIKEYAITIPGEQAIVIANDDLLDFSSSFPNQVTRFSPLVYGFLEYNTGQMLSKGGDANGSIRVWIDERENVGSDCKKLMGVYV